MTARYAIYFAPPADSPWTRFGAAWLGRCAQDGVVPRRPSLPAIAPARFAELTRGPARYGFHATLKPPFRLARGLSVEQLKDALDLLCARQKAFRMPPLAPRVLDGFLALSPTTAERRLDALAAACLRGLDRFRAALRPEEIARRRQVPLAPKEERLLQRWGYPYVLERFRFHFSLTGDLRGETPQVVAALRDAAAQALPGPSAPPLWVDAACIFEEPGAGAPLRLLHRSPFGFRGRLIYVMGPSGAGKDSLLAWVRDRLREDEGVVFARRTITRPAEPQAAGPGAESHAPATEAQFAALVERGAFAMHWRANGLRYGIPREMEQWLAAGRTVIVNGSREYLPAAQARFPQLEAVHVTAPAPVLELRLRERGRENATEAGQRLARALSLSRVQSAAALEILNDGPIEAAGRRLAAFVCEKRPNVL